MNDFFLFSFYFDDYGFIMFGFFIGVGNESCFIMDNNKTEVENIFLGSNGFNYLFLQIFMTYPFSGPHDSKIFHHVFFLKPFYIYLAVLFSILMFHAHIDILNRFGVS